MLGILREQNCGHNDPISIPAADRGPCRFDIVTNSGKAFCTPVTAATQLFFTAERGAKASMLSRAGACPSGARNGFFTTEHTEGTEDGALQVNGTTRAVAVPLARLPPFSVRSVAPW